MNTRPLSKADSDDIVELHPKIDVDTPFRGNIMNVRSQEAVLKPTEHGLNVEVLGINIHVNEDQFSVLTKQDSSKDTRVYTLDSLRVYDSNGDKIHADSMCEGDIVYDKESPHWSEDNRVEITGISDKNAKEYVIDGSSDTVADMNAGYPSTDTVVEGEYVSGGDKQYAFPISRLTNDESEVQ